MAFKQKLQIEVVVRNGLIAAFQRSRSFDANKFCISQSEIEPCAAIIGFEQLGMVDVELFNKDKSIKTETFETYTDAWNWAQAELRKLSVVENQNAV